MKKMTIKKNIAIVLSLVVLIGFFGIFNLNIPKAEAYSACAIPSQPGRIIVHFTPDFMLTSTYYEKSFNIANANIPAGTYRVTLYGYDGYDTRNTVSQPNERYYVKLMNGNTLVTSSHSTSDLQDNVTFAQVMQVVNSNLVISSNINKVVATHSAYPDSSSPNSIHLGCAAFDPVTPPPATLNGSCSVNPTSANIGDSVNWSATASGGTGSYTYSWTGTDGLIGNTISIVKTYASAGTKTGTLTITSGSQSITRTCTMIVNTPPPDTLNGSCSVSPSAINVGGYLNWSATASGGIGSYTYSWTGTDGLIGNSASVSQAYQTAGTKTGIVTITSGGQSISKTCNAVVNENITNDLSISCNASPSSADRYEDVTWHSYAYGGTGSYTYSWSGTNGLSGNSQNVTKSYSSTGTKIGTITVTSGSQTASASCSMNVVEEDNEDLNVSCYANPSTVQVGNQMRWYVNVSGGDGDYDYDWNGTNGLNSSSHYPYMTYSTPGTKTATVTVTDGDGNEDSDTCYINVNSVLAFSQTYQPPMQSAVYLSQVPYTGIADYYKSIWFFGLLALFSAWIAYIVISYQKNNQEVN